ncbi:MAG: hypothetical protein HOP19_16490 [Acidobacteria bacterium]|nr:hypothetical protein [Acidobacteriota bacterium]
MSKIQTTSHPARWAGQFALYLLLFALLISIGTYLFTSQEDQAAAPAATTSAPTPKPEAPAGATGHTTPK